MKIKIILSFLISIGSSPLFCESQKLIEELQKIKQDSHHLEQDAHFCNRMLCINEILCTHLTHLNNHIFKKNERLESQQRWIASACAIVGIGAGIYLKGLLY